MSDTLLFADDSVTMRRVVELTFAEQGLKVVTVSDGQQAIDYIRTHRPSLALISASLQKVNGFDVSRFVRDHVQTRMPVLLLAGAFDTLDETQVREAGAAGVLVKPFEPSIVIKRVKELLGMKPAAEPEPAVVPPLSDSGRFVTSPDGPARVAAASSSPSGNHAAAPAAADDRTAASEGVDYFHQLDAAFESLDAQLGTGAAAASHPKAPTSAAGIVEPAPAPEPPPSISSAFAELNAALSREASGAPATPLKDARDDTRAADLESTWFDKNSGPMPAMDWSKAPASARADQPASFGGAAPGFARAEPPARYGEAAQASAPAEGRASQAEAPATGFAPADAFAMLWAQEQGEPIPAPPPPPPVELSEQTVEALTSQLADRVAARVSAPLSERLAEDLTARLTLRLADRVTGGVADAVSRQVPSQVSDAVGDRVASEMTVRMNTGLNELAPRMADNLADRLGPQIADRLVAQLGERLANGLAEQIAERALQSTLGDALRRTVSEVAERVVRAEIDRIRAAAQQHRPQ
jgi:CheY-like chemotaxis protein